MITTGSRVILVIPAHDEAASIDGCLASVFCQSRLPDYTVVVLDNCTDQTGEIASAYPVELVTTVNNRSKKAGALNQAMNLILPELNDDDFVLCIDADSQLSEGWIESALRYFENESTGAVCGQFVGEQGHGLLGQLQRNEYYRYTRYALRQKQVPVLSGTGILYSAYCLRVLHEARGAVFRPESALEDYEMTLALKTAGFECHIAKECFTLTELMPSWRHLFRQRLRWQLGALLDLRHYGLTRVTLRYWLNQAGIYTMYIGTIVTWLTMAFYMAHHMTISIPWTVTTLVIMLAYRVVTARQGGWRSIVIALLIIPEFIYDLFRVTYLTRALFDCVRLREVQWHHVQ